MSSSSIFKQSNSTYYYASLFFQKEVRDDISILYAFVRTVDDFVDTIPQDKRSFIQFRDETKKVFHHIKTQNKLIQSFYDLAKRNDFETAWIDSFFKSMEQDLTRFTYKSFYELQRYIYGSGEVIGLMMAKMLNLPTKSHPYARLLGKAMQFLNFIRDIQEDLNLGRIYLPQDELKTYQIKNLPPHSVEETNDFRRFIDYQLQRYFTMQKEAEKGYQFIPKKYLIPIKTAADMYNWTALQIKKDPMLVFKKKVKPKSFLIVARVLKNIMTLKEF